MALQNNFFNYLVSDYIQAKHCVDGTYHNLNIRNGDKAIDKHPAKFNRRSKAITDGCGVQILEFRIQFFVITNLVEMKNGILPEGQTTKEPH